jgi:2-keto-4-pentenoate hydratase/2-oxohepta-3-ene-1,7-dioic acid hydratase in catechol pathway
VKLCRFKAAEKIFSGVIEGESVFEIEGDLFAAGLTGKVKKGKEHKLDNVKLLAPVLPSKIVAIGLNYKAHAAEFGKPLPEEPMIFIKPSTAVIGPEDEIVYPAHMSHRVDYEGELGVVIGKQAKEVQAKDAADYILGYTCVNDVTARDLQGKDIQYTRAKGFDTFAPIGPSIETGLDPLDVVIHTYLNGQLKQNTSTKDMIFNVFQLVSFVTHVMTLLPGDIISTGTPSGIGKMRPGDVVEVRIDGIGGLRNRVVDGNAARKLWLHS